MLAERPMTPRLTQALRLFQEQSHVKVWAKWHQIIFSDLSLCLD